MSHSTNKAVFRRFVATDAVDIELRDIEKEDFDGMPLYAVGRQWELGQIADTLIVNDEIVACGGVAIDEHKQGFAWIMTSDKIFDYTLSFYKRVKAMLESAIDDYGAIRVQTFVLKSNEKSKRFVEKLGFEQEGMMRKCLHNAKDRYIYARLSK